MTDQSAAPTADAAPDSERFGEEAVRLGWSALTASSGLTVLLLLLGGLLWAGAAVPQHAGARALLERYDFSFATALAELDLDHVATGWPLAALGVLLVVVAVGLVVRHQVLAGPSQRLAELWTGSGIARAVALAPGDPATVAERLRASAGPRLGASTRDGDAVVLRHGLLTEGLALTALGAVTLAAALIVSVTMGLDGRLSTIPGGGVVSPGEQRLLVRDGGRWLSRQLGVGIGCQPADPADPWRRRTCALHRRGQEATIELAAGRTTAALGLEVSLASERPLPISPRPSLLLQRQGGAAPELLATAGPSRSYTLPGDVQIVAFPGPDGPLVVTREGAAAPRLLAPGPAPAAAAAAGLRADGVPAWELEVAVRTHPERLLLLGGVALLALGLLLLALAPQGVVVLAPEGQTHTRVVAWSLNRGAWPAAVRAAAQGSEVSS